MLHQIICLTLILIVFHNAVTLRLPDGITLHKVKATWEEAQLQCQSEGLVLASPINKKIINAMQSIMAVRNSTYYIGTRAHSTSGRYVSVEGIPLENMTEVVVNMIDNLDRSHGDCLTMDHDTVNVVPCWTELPYICYDTQIYNISHTNCGTIDQGYTYEMATGKCYKAHKQLLSWDRAQEVCDDEDAHLVIIEDLAEDQIVKKMYDFSRYGWVFVGVKDVSGSGDWYSVNSRRVEKLYNVWEEDRKPANKSTRCAAINYRGELKARNCDEERYFICEK